MSECSCKMLYPPPEHTCEKHRRELQAEINSLRTENARLKGLLVESINAQLNSCEEQCIENPDMECSDCTRAKTILKELEGVK